MDLACHHLETTWQEKTTRETSQAVERRLGHILERHDMAEDNTRQANLEAFAQPRGTLPMMVMVKSPPFSCFRLLAVDAIVVVCEYRFGNECYIKFEIHLLDIPLSTFTHSSLYPPSSSFDASYYIRREDLQFWQSYNSIRLWNI